MSVAIELSDLFRRDLTRLIQELRAFPDERDLWRCLPGTANSAGNLTLHLEGNLREYIGRQLGKLPYRRQRALEFSTRGLAAADLIQRIEAVRDEIPAVVRRLAALELATIYPEEVYRAPITTRQLLISLHAHLNYHLGQIDYLRRGLTGGAPIDFAGL